MLFEKQVMNIYKSRLLKRFDPDGTAYYFSKQDFESLRSNDFTFTGNKGQRLSAHIYFKDDAKTDRIIIFEHGMGCGHRAYLREIDLLCTHGYTVYTYDHTGTLDSEGEHIRGFSQSLCDLKYAIDALRQIPEYSASSLCVIGHSWGGFSAMNSTSVCPEITHIVALAGFISPKVIQAQNFRGVLSLYRKAAFRLEEEEFGELAHVSALDSLDNSNAKALIIHSKDDNIVNYNMHFGVLKEKFKNRDNIYFFEIDGKKHNPNYTCDAIKYKSQFYDDLNSKAKKGLLETEDEREKFRNSYDWIRMTEQDMNVWNRIFEFLDCIS